MKLVIQTVRPEIEIALFDGKQIVKSQKWRSERDEVAKVLPAIEKICGEIDPQEIIVFNGKGAFSSTRIGVTIANTMAYAKKLPLEQITIENDDQRNLLEILETSKLEPVQIAVPVYSKEPNITISDKNK
ncbi:hypothetical protein GF376_03430 [Candidatus Peregrinibacteria bacterium]|nr:hypothetical protein [Candidatus Peregrinibacteria bacterium]